MIGDLRIAIIWCAPCISVKARRKATGYNFFIPILVQGGPLLTTPSFTVPESAVLSLGGFTGYKTAEWDRFFLESVRRIHPWYYLRCRFGMEREDWKTNDCVLQSLKEYVLQEFGILLPEKSLFHVYNRGGKGLLPRDLLKAVQAVIEPLGLELDRVVVADDTLRGALGCADCITDLAGGEDLHGKPGICMINIENGYSHAFFWSAINTRKFHDPAFRLALRLRWKNPIQPSFSCLKGLCGYSELAKDYFSMRAGLPVGSIGEVLSQLSGLKCVLQGTLAAEVQRTLLVSGMESVLSILRSAAAPKPQPADQHMLEAGEMLLEIFRLAPLVA